MKQKDFSLALNALLPGCDPEAASKWAEFADECVDRKHYAHFIPAEHDTAVEMWLDATYAGLYAVMQKHGQEIAAKVAGLSCHQCALYPGEMMQAAKVLRKGGDAEEIGRMMANDELNTEKPFFFDLPDGALLTRQGPEISIAQSGVPYGLMQKRMEPGFLLADGTALLESERDGFGRYRGGAGMDGMYLQTGQLYAPVRGGDGQVKAFQEVKPVTAREREAAFLASQGDALAIYRMRPTTPLNGYVPLVRLQKSGESPLAGHYDLIHVAPLAPGTDAGKTLDAYQKNLALVPCDIVAFKQNGAVTCWFVDHLAYSKMHGLLENYLKAAEMESEQNYNQIDGVINNEAPKPSVRDNLRQCQREAGKSQDGAASPTPRHDSER